MRREIGGHVFALVLTLCVVVLAAWVGLYENPAGVIVRAVLFGAIYLGCYAVAVSK